MTEREERMRVAGPIAHIGHESSDGRCITGLTVKVLPLPLLAMSDEIGNYRPVGMISEVEFSEGGTVWATGWVQPGFSPDHKIPVGIDMDGTECAPIGADEIMYLSGRLMGAHLGSNPPWDTYLKATGKPY